MSRRALNSSNARVTVASPVNVYSYNRQLLIITYAITCGMSLIGVLIGFRAYVSNGVSHDISFSAFMSTTRNHRLDKLTMGQSMGAMPLNDKVRRTKLKFGLLDRDGGMEGRDRSRRAGFGFEDEVTTLQKEMPYH